MTEKKAIVFVVDDAYAEPARLAIRDVWWHSGGRYPVYVCHGMNLNQQSKARIQKIADDNEIDLRFRDISRFGDTFGSLTTRNHVSLVAYAKLTFADLIWDGINFAYYFDVDILVLRDLRELFAIEPRKAIAAVNHRADYERARLLGEEGAYYNTGVFIANLPRWNSINSMERTRNAIASHSEKFKYNDQDVIAVAFDGEIEELPLEYNFMMNGRFNPYIKNGGEKDWNPAEIDPAILHFIGPVKPWSANSNGKSHKMWRKRINLI